VLNLPAVKVIKLIDHPCRARTSFCWHRYCDKNAGQQGEYGFIRLGSV
jgi:hypothetical protein